tara:strand:- start:1081 stop:1797 length:717 start_codon:yes stop_codon:yes gene_type:complete
MQLKNLTFFKRQSHLLMDEPQIVVLTNGISFNAAFSKKIIQSGYKHCKLATDAKDNDYGTANNLFIFLTNEDIGAGGTILPLTHPQKTQACVRYFVACKELVDRVPRFAAMRKSSTRSERRLLVKQIQEDVYVAVIEPNCENEVFNYKDLPKKGGVYKYTEDGVVVEIGSTNNLKMRASQHVKDGMKFDTIQFSLIDNANERYKVERKHMEAYEAKYGKKPKYNKNLPPKTKGGLRLI